MSGNINIRARVNPLFSSFFFFFPNVQILGKSLRVDHVSDYKPPKDNDKYDDETRLLHTEGCAPKEQLPPSQIKREPPEEEISGGVRLPMRLPIDDIKRDKDVKMVFPSLNFINTIH